MQNFTKYVGIVAPFEASNIDTDIIIPKQFLQKITKTGFGKHLFHNWRFSDDCGFVENPQFILNKKDYRNASILLTRNNFGCGSSREHAVWALTGYGFKVIIAHSFSDIFLNNCLNNRLLLISLSNSIIDKMFFIVNNNIGINCTVDLLKEKIFIGKHHFSFIIDCVKKQSIMYGFDNIDYTLKHEKKIKLYEKINKQYDLI